MNFNFALLIIFFFLINSFIIIFIDKLIYFFNIYDYPDTSRKFHKKKTSLLGGSIILLNLVIFYILNLYLNNQLINNINLNQLMIGVVLFYFLGLIDDKIDLSANLKFIFELLIVFLVITFDKNIIIERLFFSSLNINIFLGSYSFLFTTICIVIFLNALNMFDGMNGQAGFYSLIIFLTLMFFLREDLLFLTIIISSLIIFLYFNLKSKVFLGDNGTNLLGFLISYLIIISAKKNNYLLLSADQIFMLMILPGLELMRLFVARSLQRKHPFSSDRNHIHHKLLSRYSEVKSLVIILLLIITSVVFLFFFNNLLYLFIIIYTFFYLLIIKMNDK